MEYTKYYNLKLPQADDTADIDDLNYNNNLLDDLAKDFALAISDNTDNCNALSKQLSAEISTISISEFKQMMKGN